MKIYIEEALFVSLFINFFILKSVCLFVRQKGRLIFLSASLSTAISLLVPLYNMPSYVRLFLILFVGIINILISFKYKSFKNFAMLFAVFVFSTFLFGGGCYALQSLVGTFPLFIVSIVGFAIYTLLCVIFKVVTHHNNLKKFTYNLTFKDGGKVIAEEGYLDSGNVLYDTITKKPIVLVSYEVFKKFYEDVSLMDLVTKKVEMSSIKNGHYIKINSVGKGTQMLIFTIDEMELEDKQYKDVAVGLSFSGFEKSFGKGVLLNLDYI